MAWRKAGSGRWGRLAAAALLALACACAERPPIDVEARGGNRSGIDWRIGIPF